MNSICTNYSLKKAPPCHHFRCCIVIRWREYCTSPLLVGVASTQGCRQHFWHISLCTCEGSWAVQAEECAVAGVEDTRNSPHRSSPRLWKPGERRERSLPPALAPANHPRSRKLGQWKRKTNSTDPAVGCLPCHRSETRMGSGASLPPENINSI